MKKAPPPKAARTPRLREPVDVVDGIADRSRNRPPWKYIVPAVIFLAWLAFLIYCLLAGARQ